MRRIAHTIGYGTSPLCTGKAGYDNMTQARNAARARQPYERQRLYWYRCQHPQCPFWHLTRKRPPREWMREK